jgi:hypothetical protein
LYNLVFGCILGFLSLFLKDAMDDEFTVSSGRLFQSLIVAGTKLFI